MANQDEGVKVSIETVGALTHIKTPQGRARAWTRFALVEKKLADHLPILRKGGLLTRYYNEEALFRDSEQFDMLLGLLLSLSVVDFDLCLKVSRKKTVSKLILILCFKIP